MPVIGITGGIASGKSTLIKSLTSILPCKFFSTDAYGRELLEDSSIGQILEATFGSHVIDSETGKPSRYKLREVLVQSQENRILLGNILHPAIRQKWLQWAKDEQEKDPKILLFVEIPLLFEVEAQSHFDKIILIAAEPAIQLQRLIETRGVTEEMGRLLIKTQLELELKLRYADYVIWNNVNHTTYHVKKQIELCVNLLKATFLNP